MAHFYGEVQGGRGDAHQIGHRTTGLGTTAASWEGAVQVALWYDEDQGCDWVRVRLARWHGRGVDYLLYDGPVGGSEAIQVLLALEKGA